MHRPSTVPRLLVGLGVAALALTGSGAGRGTVDAAVPEQDGAGLQTETHRAMETMMQAMESTPLSGTPEQDFLALMIPHHQGAIDMARALLVYGRDPLVRQLAEEIIATQQVEIQSMQNRLAILRAQRTPDSAADQALGGTRGTDDTAPPHHEH